MSGVVNGSRCPDTRDPRLRSRYADTRRQYVAMCCRPTTLAQHRRRPAASPEPISAHPFPRTAGHSTAGSKMTNAAKLRHIGPRGDGVTGRRKRRGCHPRAGDAVEQAHGHEGPVDHEGLWTTKGRWTRRAGGQGGHEEPVGGVDATADAVAAAGGTSGQRPGSSRWSGPPGWAALVAARLGPPARADPLAPVGASPGRPIGGRPIGERPIGGLPIEGGSRRPIRTRP